MIVKLTVLTVFESNMLDFLSSGLTPVNLGPHSVICVPFKPFEAVTAIQARNVGQHPICLLVPNLDDCAFQWNAMLICNDPIHIT